MSTYYLVPTNNLTEACLSRKDWPNQVRTVVIPSAVNVASDIAGVTRY